ncbi:unnamed protein product [Rhizoctonia solani]|uniref:RING-type E3 ubiquitin transferase n=1 Tax=Rhizoctonia solani TaxID=456999 RepID=A0A8H3BDZ9_9AGAM|nr:unnamed protein product [Rhizoctonia solani]CAE6506004.1 unnamed protein product [Rhizoctonia solani]
MSNHRPPRAVCRYFSTPRGCRAGSTCLYAHSTTPGPSPRQEKQICIYYNKGYCKRGASCWYLHAGPASSSKEETSKPKESEDLVCSICFDMPTEFGLLAGCSHVFCLKCIMDWRSSKNKDTEVVISNTNKTCPVCRAPSKFITPSSRFTPKDSPERALCVEGYKATLGKIPCRYFVKSPPHKRFCPYGKDCFYQHQNEDGTPYVFDLGADEMMEKHKSSLTASRALNSTALFDLMARRWYDGPHFDHYIYDSDEDYDYHGSDISELVDWMPSLVF